MTMTIPALTLRPINLDWAHIAASVERLQYFKSPRSRRSRPSALLQVLAMMALGGRP